MQLGKILAGVYLIGLVFAEGLRWYFRWGRVGQQDKGRIAIQQFVGVERLVMAGILIGIWALPILYTITSWLQWADYQLTVGWGLLGVFVFGLSLWLRYRAQRDLQRNWSPTLIIWEGHELIQDGVYRWVRHPLYASLWLWGLAQPLLIQNWLAGWVGLVAVGLLSMVRIPREEAMMEVHFGRAYQEYSQRTGGLVPKLGRRDKDLLKEENSVDDE